MPKRDDVLTLTVRETDPDILRGGTRVGTTRDIGGSRTVQESGHGRYPWHAEVWCDLRAKAKLMMIFQVVCYTIWDS